MRKDIRTVKCQHPGCTKFIQYNVKYRAHAPQFCYEHLSVSDEVDRRMTKADLELLAYSNIFPEEYYQKDGSFVPGLRDNLPFLDDVTIEQLLLFDELERWDTKKETIN